MSVTKKLSAFAAGLVVAFGAGYGVGTVVDPVLDDDQHEAPVTQPTHGGVHAP